MRLLVTAFACRPGAGSEAGNGWNIPLELARLGHEVTVLTRPDFEAPIKSYLERKPEEGLSFVYVRAPTWPMRLVEKPLRGQAYAVGAAVEYVLWQWRAACLARHLDAQRAFGLVYHVSYGTLLGGSFLWLTRRPLVFGPTGGGQTAPAAFLAQFGAGRREEAVRTFVVRFLWMLDFPALMTARVAALVLATNAETVELARRLGARRVEPMVDVGLPPEFLPAELPVRAPGDVVKLLWVGRFMPRKGLRLSFEALARVARDVPVHLTVVGRGVTDQLDVEIRALPEVLGVGDRVTFRGELPWEETRDEYARADVFFFASLRDSCSAQLLEAMAWGLPIVTLDHHGGAWLVPDEAGIKVPVTSPEATAQALARALEELARDPERRVRCGRAGAEVARTLVWPAKVGRIAEALDSVVGAPPAGAAPAYSADGQDPMEWYAERNARFDPSEGDDFTAERYGQFSRHLPAGRPRVLDLGSGIGIGGRALKALRPELSLVALDCLEDRLLRLPEDVYDERIHASATEVPLPDASVDAVLAGEFIEHLSPEDVDQALAEVSRLLREGGVLLLTTPNPDALKLRLTGRTVVGGAHLSAHAAAPLEARLRMHGLEPIRRRGSGRATRRFGERFPLLSLYGSYLVVAAKPPRDGTIGGRR